MSLFFLASETQGDPQSKPRKYDELELIGKGLQRLSYFIESRYVTRRFKNHLKHLGIFDPKYRRDDDRQQVFLKRPKLRRFSKDISNRRFKAAYIRQNKTIRGLKSLPRVEVVQQPLHVGTLRVSQGKFFPNPLLQRSERRLAFTGPVKRAQRLLRKAAKKLRTKAQRQEPGGNGPGQLPTNPVGHLFSERSMSRLPRVVLISMSGEYPHLLGGTTFPNFGDLATRWPSGEFRFFVFGKDDTIYPTQIVDSAGPD